MAQSKFTLYKYIKLADGSWRYCKAAFYSNGKIKPNRCIIGGKEEEHSEGSYYLYHKKSWMPVGANALDAQRRRNAQLDNYELKRLPGTVALESPAAAANVGKTPLATASQQYFSNLEARGADPKTIRTYRTAVDPFIESCSRIYLEDVTKQDMINFMGWLRKQPLTQRRNSNPDRTYANKVGHIAIFLKTFGVSRLLKKSEYPQYEEKMVSAHTDEELGYLYADADAEQRFLLDFGLNSGFRDGELSHAEYSDLIGNTLEVKRKPHLHWNPKKHHCRKVTVSQKFADAFRARGKSSKTSLVFPNEAGKPNQHLLRDLQALTPNDKPFPHRTAQTPQDVGDSTRSRWHGTSRSAEAARAQKPSHHTEVPRRRGPHLQRAHRCGRESHLHANAEGREDGNGQQIVHWCRRSAFSLSSNEAVNVVCTLPEVYST